MAGISTSIERELEEQERWKRLAVSKNDALFKRLLENEFRSPEFHQTRQSEKLRHLVHFAEKQVPFYGERMAFAGVKPRDVSRIEDLPKLPVLSKTDLLDQFDAMHARNLPKGEEKAEVTQSSGTTGRPVSVTQTVSANQFFTILWCRQARWFRLNPGGVFARIRLPENLRTRPDESDLPAGKTLIHSRWSYMGRFFKTGPEIACTIGNPREWQIKWLQEHSPDYLLSFPGILEELALANECRRPVESIRGLISVASQLTPSMQDLIERVFEVPVHQNYGLNEIGMVATRCAAGRYHVHSEACLVEIVDEDGQPVAAGETGRLLVTSFRNLLMPLIRYDTGDMAVAADGPCPCGRTLPSFENVAGRYRRFACLPEGSRERYTALSSTIGKMPPDLLLNLRQYQVHQFRDNRFELRLRISDPLPEAFFDRIREAWIGVAGEENRDALEFRDVDEMEAAPGGKLLDFTSDFYPEVDSSELS